MDHKQLSTDFSLLSALWLYRWKGRYIKYQILDIKYQISNIDQVEVPGSIYCFTYMHSWLIRFEIELKWT